MIRSRIFLPFLFILTALSQSACFRHQETSGQSTTLQSDTKHHIAPKTVEDLYELFTYRDNRYPLVSAHRGGPAPGFPENALETFERIANIHPVIIECDIQMTRDSVLILMHDDRLDRTTDGNGSIAEIDYAQLSTVRLRDKNGQATDYQIPTLAQALQWGKGKVVFTLDVKRNVPYHLVIDEIKNSQAEPFSVIITYNANQAAQVHKLAPELMLSVSIRNISDLKRLNSLGIPNRLMVAFVGTSEADPSIYTMFHDQGISTIVGTMGNLDAQATRQGEQRYAEIVSRGADILSTDRPIEAGNALQQLVEKNRLSSPFIR